MGDLADDVVYKIVRGNAIRMLGLDLGPLGDGSRASRTSPSSTDPPTSATSADTRPRPAATTRAGPPVPQRLAVVPERRATSRALRDELGVRTVIDLRAGHEVEEYGHGPLAAPRASAPPARSWTRRGDPPTTRGGRSGGRRSSRRSTRSTRFMLREYADRFGDGAPSDRRSGDSHPAGVPLRGRARTGPAWWPRSS